MVNAGTFDSYKLQKISTVVDIAYINTLRAKRYKLQKISTVVDLLNAGLEIFSYKFQKISTVVDT